MRSGEEVVSEIEGQAADLLHAGGAENFGDALWETLQGVPSADRAIYMFTLRSAHAEMQALQDDPSALVELVATHLEDEDERDIAVMDFIENAMAQENTD